MALLSISLYAQKTQVPQIDDNTVIVKTEVDSITFNRLKVTLISNGYRIKEQDKSIGYIQTDYKSIEGSSVAIEPEIAISLLIRNYDISMYADYRFKGSAAFGGGDYSGRASYQQRKNIGKRLAFDELCRIASLIGNEIKYVKQ